nr:MAG TPA: hypothetical protein [Caudoviricetes sp.]
MISNCNCCLSWVIKAVANLFYYNRFMVRLLIIIITKIINILNPSLVSDFIFIQLISR